jgi:dihydrofolate reductase/thymidylate synthase
MINLIACVTNYKNKLAIGQNNELLFKLKGDMTFFRKITTGSLSPSSKLNCNIVLMGRKTYDSLPENCRPLKDRINIVLTRNKELIKKSPVPENLLLTKDVYFTDDLTFEKVYKKYNPNVFVIGGSELYNKFLGRADKLYLTVVEAKLNVIPDAFMDYLDSRYSLVSFSEKFVETSSNSNTQTISYRILYYINTGNKSNEYEYLDLARRILNKGNTRSDRTGTGTVSIFGNQMRFDISKTIPLLTTKRVPFVMTVEELLWFCRGDTDATILQKKGIKIWDGNTSREFLDNRGLKDYPEGTIGPQYGFLWRFFGADYSPEFRDTSKIDMSSVGGFDQLKNVEHLLKTDPFSRRIMISAWNPAQLHEQALPSCHVLIQFYVEEINKEKYLSCQFYMRSNDLFLGNPVNIASYSILTYILAKKCGMKPKELIYTCGDTHIYANHLQQIEEQIKRIPRPFPKLHLSKSVETKDWKDLSIEDFELIGYFPHPTIKGAMAI